MTSSKIANTQLALRLPVFHPNLQNHCSHEKKNTNEYINKNFGQCTKILSFEKSGTLPLLQAEGKYYQNQILIINEPAT